MNHIPWIPIVERPPPPDTYVIFFHEEPDGKTFTSPGWVQSDDQYCWNFYRISDGLRQGRVCFVEMSATDFWLAIPSEPPQHNVVNGGYPA